MIVQLRGAPLRVWERSAQHNADLLREFSLIRIGQPDALVPTDLLTLMTDLQARYSGVGTEAELMRQEALAAGELSVDLDYDVPAEAGAACRHLLDMLEEAADFCERGVLMTLPPPPDQRDFNAWYLGEFIRQTTGAAPGAWAGSYA